MFSDAQCPKFKELHMYDILMNSKDLFGHEIRTAGEEQGVEK